MEPVILLKLIIILAFLLLCAFLSMSEVALFSLGPLRLQKMKDERRDSVGTIEKLLDQPRRLLISILLGNEIGNIVASTLVTPLFLSYLGDRGRWIAIMTMTFLIVFLCDIIPKSIGLAHPERITTTVARPMMGFVRFIAPLRWILNYLIDRITSFLGIRRDPRENIFMEAEFKDLVDLGRREGSIEEAERNLIHRVFRLGDTRVAMVMTPREQIFSLPLDLGFEKMLKQVKEKQYSRIPIYSKDRNNIVGILNAKDLLPLTCDKVNQNMTLMKLLRKPLLVPANQRIDELLRELQQKKVHMAIVVNERGTVIGLVTMEDILEEIFGEIYDEYDI